MDRPLSEIEPIRAAQGGGDKNVAEVFAHSAAYTLVQSPVNAVAQLVDRVADTDLLPQVQLISAPETVEFSLSNPSWYAQQLGNATAMATHFYVLNKVTGGKSLPAGSEAMSAASAMELTAKSAGLGALYSGVFTPTSGDSNFWQSRAINSLAGAVTFGTLTASAIGTKALGQSLEPLSKTVSTALKSDLVNGAVSGIPAGIVSADTHSLLSGHGFASNKERFESVYSFSVIGAGLSAAHLAESKVTEGSTKFQRAFSDGTAELSARMSKLGQFGSDLANSLSISGPQMELAGTGGLRTPLYMMSEATTPGGRSGSESLVSTGTKPIDAAGIIEPANTAQVTNNPEVKIAKEGTTSPEISNTAEVTNTEPADASDTPAAPKRLPNYADAMNIANDALVERALGDTQAADKLADKAMKLAGLEGDTDFAAAIREHVPDGDWRSWRKNQTADPALKQAFALMSTAYGPAHLKVVSTLEQLLAHTPESFNTHTLQHVHKYMMEARKAQFGDQHPEYANAVHQMADMQSYQGKYDNALPLLKKAAEIRQKVYGPESQAYLQTISDIAKVHIQKREYAQAEPLLKETKATLERTSGSDRLLTVTVLDALAEVYVETGRRAEAEPLLAKAIETGRYAPNAANTLRHSMTQLAGIYLWWGRIPEAQKIYEQSRYRFGLPPRPSDSAGRRTVFDEINSTSNPYLETLDQLKLGHRDADNYYMRQVLTRKYSWAIPNEEALSTVASVGPVVELGAGTGYWAALLRARGVDVVAYDKHPVETGTNHYHPNLTESWTKILDGDESSVAKHPDRTLFLSWPVYGEPVAYNALTAFKGDKVVYIGEGWGGCTGDDKFHTQLDKDFTLEKEVDIPQWDGIRDWMRIYHRKRPGEPGTDGK